MIITPYAGFGFDQTSMDFKYGYVYDNPVPPPDLLESPVTKTIDASTGRFTLGLNLSPIPFVNIFADYNFGKFSEITAGLAVGFR